MNNTDNANENKMSRGEFLKKTAIGAAAAAIVVKFGGGVMNTLADTTVTNNDDNKQYVSDTPPTDKSRTWIDTSVGGVMKFWNGSEWTPVKSTWG